MSQEGEDAVKRFRQRRLEWEVKTPTFHRGKDWRVEENP